MEIEICIRVLQSHTAECLIRYFNLLSWRNRGWVVELKMVFNFLSWRNHGWVVQLKMVFNLLSWHNHSWVVELKMVIVGIRGGQQPTSCIQVRRPHRTRGTLKKIQHRCLVFWGWDGKRLGNVVLPTVTKVLKA